MFYFTMPLYQTRDGQGIGSLDGVFYTNQLCKDHLIHCILTVYIGKLQFNSYNSLVEVEHTGANSQFYDKFNIRYNISQILKKVCIDLQFKEKLIQESSIVDFFVKFVNLLMNDTTYLLDESLTKLSEIKTLQSEMQSPSYPTSSAVNINQNLY